VCLAKLMCRHVIGSQGEREEDRQRQRKFGNEINVIFFL
jgi:hypothetical protein